MADENNVIGIRFGVKGGKDINGDSGDRIKRELEAIANQIDLTVMVNVKAAKNGNDAITRGVDKQKEAYNSVIPTLQKLWKIREQIAKIPVTGKGDAASVHGQLLKEQEQQLKEQYEEQLGQLKEIAATDESRSETIQRQIQAVEALNKAYGKARSAPQVASRTDVTKLDLKSQSLYVDNGFDKVIARSEEAKKLVDEFRRKVVALVADPSSATKQQVKALNDEFLSTEANLKRIQRETDTAGNKIKEAFGSRIIQRFAQMLLLLVVRALREVYDNVKNIDTALTQLQIVTSATAKELKAAARDIASSAKDIGASIPDLINSTTVYARLGYSLREAQQLAKYTTIYANITGVNVDEATTNITGAIKAYGLSVDELESTLDKFIWVGNHFAISQAEIGEAMNNAAASLKAGGNSIDEAMAILAAANASVQNISKSSTGVRTLVARINESDAELMALGEDVGDVLSRAKLDEIMRGYGVAITDVNGDLRSTYDILNDLSKIWGSLSKIDQSAIGEMFAGKRQREVFESIMNNWGDAQDVLNGISSSTKSLTKANEVYLSSIEGKTKQIKAQWEDFSTKLLNSKAVTFILDVVTELAGALNRVTGFAGGSISQIVLASSAVMLLSKAYGVLYSKFDKVAKGIGKIDMSGPLIGAEDSARKTSLGLKELMSSTFGLCTAFALFAVATGAFDRAGEEASNFAHITIGAITAVGAAIMAFNSSHPLGWISLAVTGISSLVQGIVGLFRSKSYTALKDAAKESKEAWSEAENELKEVTDRLDEIKERRDELNKKKLNLVDKNELEMLEKEAELLTQEAANNESILAAKQRLAQSEKDRAAQDTAKALNKYSNSPMTWWHYDPNRFSDSPFSNFGGTRAQVFRYMLQDFQNISDLDRNTLEAGLREYEELLSEFSLGDSEELDKYLYEWYQLLDGYNFQTGNIATVWDRILHDTRFADEIEKLQNLANDKTRSVTFQNVIETLGEDSPFLAYLKEIGVYTEGDAESTDALVESIKELRDSAKSIPKLSFTDDLELMQDKFDALQNALSDIEDNGVVSMDNIGKIIDASAEGYPELLEKYFKFVEGVGYQLVDDWAGKSWTDILSAMAQDDIQRYVTELNNAQQMLDGMAIDDEDRENAINNVATAQDNLNKKITEWATLLREQALEDETKRREKEKEALEDQLDAYQDLIEMRKDLLETYQEEVNYQKELAQKQKAVADLQTQLTVAALDTSAAGQARFRELQSQLEEAQEELDEYTLDKAVSDLTEQLDKDYGEYESFIQSQVDRIVEEIEQLKTNFHLNLTPNTDGSVTAESHHAGGFAGNVVTLKSNETFAKLIKGELVSTPKQMDDFIRKILPAMIRDAPNTAIINNNSPLIEVRCGDIDRETLPQFKEIVNAAVKKVQENMADALQRSGYKK